MDAFVTPGGAVFYETPLQRAEALASAVGTDLPPAAVKLAERAAHIERRAGSYVDFGGLSDMPWIAPAELRNGTDAKADAAISAFIGAVADRRAAADPHVQDGLRRAVAALRAEAGDLAVRELVPAAYTRLEGLGKELAGPWEALRAAVPDLPWRELADRGKVFDTAERAGADLAQVAGHHVAATLAGHRVSAIVGALGRPPASNVGLSSDQVIITWLAELAPAKDAVKAFRVGLPAGASWGVLSGGEGSLGRLHVATVPALAVTDQRPEVTAHAERMRAAVMLLEGRNRVAELADQRAGNRADAMLKAWAPAPNDQLAKATARAMSRG